MWRIVEKGQVLPTLGRGEGHTLCRGSMDSSGHHEMHVGAEELTVVAHCHAPSSQADARRHVRMAVGLLQVCFLLESQGHYEDTILPAAKLSANLTNAYGDEHGPKNPFKPK
jgi:hypothetical protein